MMQELFNPCKFCQETVLTSIVTHEQEKNAKSSLKKVYFMEDY